MKTLSPQLISEYLKYEDIRYFSSKCNISVACAYKYLKEEGNYRYSTAVKITNYIMNGIDLQLDTTLNKLKDLKKLKIKLKKAIK